MTPSVSGRDPVEKLAEEFAERYRKGERPSLSEYTTRYPELSQQIRELFPALVVMEEFGSVAGAATGPFAPRGEADKPVPPQLGEYRILRQVGQGGMGVVYEAVQESLGRHVALKVLPVHGKLNPTMLERFRREARAAAGLHHTNIVPVFGVGEAAGIHYYAMQFIQGHSLDAILHELRRTRDSKGESGNGPRTPRSDITITLAQTLVTGTLLAAPPCATDEPSVAPAAKAQVQAQSARPAAPPSTHSELAASTELAYYLSVARIGLQAAEALGYAHAQGILHRDVKPSNLLLDTRGTVWITDFGLAKATDSADLTQLGDIIGTLRYMAPERFRGQSEWRSDIYSLGATLYELLTLHSAFESGDRVRLIEQITHEDPLPPRQRDARIPRDLETIVLKAMAKDSDDRYADAAELAEDLRRFLADRPILARRSSAVERTWRWCRRNPALACLTASVLLLLVVIAAGSSVAAMRLADERSRVINESERAHNAERDLLAEKNSTTQLLDSYLGQLRLNRAGRQPGHRIKSLEMLAGLAARNPSLELRNEAIPFLMLHDLKVGPSWELPPGWRTGPIFDGHATRYVLADGDNQGGGQGHISVRRVLDHQEIAALPGFGVRVVFMHLSPNGEFLAVKYHDDRDIQFYVWDVERRQAIVKERHGIRDSAVDFSPDERTVAVGHPDGSLRFYELPSGKLVRTLASALPVHSLRYHPAGKQLAVSSLKAPGAQILDLAKGQVVSLLTHPAGVRGLAWRSDGKQLAAATNNGPIYVWDLAQTPLSNKILRGHENAAVQVAFNRAGDWLASTSWDGTTRLWDLPTSRQLLSTPSPSGSQFNPDDRYLAFARDGAKVWLWEVVAGRSCRTFRGPANLRSAALGLDGRLLAAAGTDGIRLWDVACQEEHRKLLAFIPVPAYSVMFHPTDQSLITSGAAGLLRWPITHKADAADDVVGIGPPHKLADLSGLEEATLSADGKTAVVDFGNGRGALVDLEQPERVLPLEGQRGMTFWSFSPNGTWLATGNWQGESGVWIWDARTGKSIHQMTLPGTTVARFSPDGKWLVTSTSTEYVFWEPGSWKPIRTIPRAGAANLPGDPSFSPDGVMLALAHSRTEVRLIDPQNGQELATLPTSGGPLGWSADGSLLATVGVNQVIQVWDLREIRRELAALNLDWRLPAFAPGDPKSARPLRAVEVVLGDLKDVHKARLDQHSRILASNPSNALACNNLAWFLLTGPASLRDPKKALPLAQRAMQLAPKNPLYANTVGVAFYRLGKHESAVAILEHNLPLHEQHLQPFDLFFLAMSRHRLGDEAKAREAFARAVALVEEHWPHYSAEDRRELSDFRGEAEAVLGFGKK